MVAGADLGGQRAVLLMQSSGVGNSINMLSLTQGGRFPLLTLISMRGEFGEGNPWQFAMGQAVEPVLKAMGVIVLRADHPSDVIPCVTAAITMAFQSGQQVAVLLTQRLIGAKKFYMIAPFRWHVIGDQVKRDAVMAKLNKLQTATLPDAVLDRRQAVPALIENPGDFLMVAGLAGTAWELSALTHESPSLFGLGGAMGAAPMMGLGLALAQPKRRVLVATGDGELLMNVGALATIALQNPPNLTIICVDNGHYGETGNQDSHTGLGVRLDVIAAGCGFPVVHVINTEADMAEGRRLVREGGGLSFILLRVTEGPATHDGKKNLVPHIERDRFRAALLG